MRRAPSGVWIATAFAGAVAAGCGDPVITEIVVLVESDAVPGTDLHEVEIAIDGPSGRVSSTGSLEGVGSLTFPVSVTLVPGEDSPDDVHFRATAIGYLDDVAVVTRSASTWFVPGRSLMLRLPLESSCFMILCAEPGSTCEAGICRNDKVMGDDLPPWEGG